jgi:molecular chaperone Hsp33
MSTKLAEKPLDQNLNARSDRWVKCIAKGGGLLATAISAPNLVADAGNRHKLTPIEIKALGETLLASLLLSSMCKPGEKVSLSLKGDKLFKQAIADANPQGEARGFIIAKEFEGDIDIEMGPWQHGYLSVIRQKEHEKEPYVGTVPLLTGYLAKDLTYYLLQSEQIPAAVGLAVKVSEKGFIESAGAFLVQALPGASEDEIKLVEEKVNAMGDLAKQVALDANPTLVLGRLFGDLGFTLIDERPLKFSCQCTADKVKNALRLLGAKEIQQMINEDQGAKINCDFCSEEYAFNAEDLRRLMN